MRADHFRFRPPECHLEPALRWTLSRAFGLLELTAPELSEEERARVSGWAKGLSLGERIACRTERAHLVSQLGEGPAESLLHSRDALAARTLLLDRLLEHATTTAAEIACPVVALKGIALLELGASSYGARPLADVDLLVAPERAAELAARLEARGLESCGSDERHHLSPLAHPQLGHLELHLALPGILLEDGATTPKAMDRAGLTTPSERLAGLLLPRTPLLVAHLMAHALDQHAFAPRVYPLTRLIADLLDLADREGRALTDLVDEAQPFLRASVSSRERRACVDLCERLARADEEPLAADDDAARLLAHAVAGLTLPAYRRSLRRRAALRAIGRGDWRKLRPRPRAGAE
jgi:hypothetical protein